MTFPGFQTADGRRAWAFMALVGAAMVFTVFAAVGVWLVSRNVPYSFYLALAAHVQVFVVLFAIGALLVRRTIRASRDGIEISDSSEAAQEVADAAQVRADEIIKEPTPPPKDDIR